MFYLIYTAIMVSAIQSMSLAIACVAIISKWLGNEEWKKQSDGSISEFTASEYTMCVLIMIILSWTFLRCYEYFCTTCCYVVAM